MSGSGPARELNRSRMAEAALKNESLTRERVSRLESRVSMLEPYIWPAAVSAGQVRLLTLFEQMEPLRRGFWGRLRWLVTGR